MEKGVSEHDSVAVRGQIIELLQPGLARLDLSADALDGARSLLEQGVVDSFGFLQLVMTLEEKRGQSIDFSGSSPEVFTTLDGLTALIAGPAGDGHDASQTLNAQTLEAVLRDLGLGAGDRLLVHSSVEVLGWPEGGVEMYLDTLQRIIGADGTIVVPTFTFSFCTGAPFDLNATPSENMGVFTELVRTHPHALRTHHPMQSMAVLGRDAERLAGMKTASAYGEGSAWAALPEMGYKMLLLGARPQSAAIIHVCEERANVPYRYWKDFTGPAAFGGESATVTYPMFVRNLDADADIDEDRVRVRMIENGAWAETPVNAGVVATCDLKAYVDTALAMLDEDPYALVIDAARVKAAIAEQRS